MRSAVAILLTGIVAGGLVSCGGPEESAAVEKAAAGCNRQCLEGYANKYLSAMVAHDPSQAPFAEHVKFTENARELPLSAAGESLWATASTLNDYRFFIADPEAEQVAFVGLIKEQRPAQDGDAAAAGGNGASAAQTPALLSMRLRVEHKQITEAETIVVRNLNADRMWTLRSPPKEFSTALPTTERITRAELVKVSNLYFDGIEQLNSKIVPWHNECYRLENGMWTAGPELPREIAVHMPDPDQLAPAPGGGPAGSPRRTCAAGLDSGALAVIENIRPRRTPVVDVERGVTWGVYMFNHKGVETITMPDGSTAPAPYFAGRPNSMPMSELFKIKAGRIRDIMAIGVINPYGSGSGWE